jgi:NAD(P)-dependent dehydrogenase (short-subunit alcohol dehydrogenase family)
MGVDPRGGRLRYGPRGQDGQGRSDAPPRHEFGELLSLLSHAVNAMTRSGQGGRIVNVAARQALEWRGGAGLVAYTSSKAAVAALTVALSEEVAKEGILVNAVAPSIMDTPANRTAMPKADYQAWPKVEEVAATILFLASPENKVTRGAVVPVYGRS